MCPMSQVVSAEAAGTVVTVNVEAGQQVEVNDTILVLDSLTLEVPVPAPVSGTVVEVIVKAGDDVHEDEPLFVIAED